MNGWAKVASRIILLVFVFAQECIAADQQLAAINSYLVNFSMTGWSSISHEAVQSSIKRGWGFHCQILNGSLFVGHEVSGYETRNHAVMLFLAQVADSHELPDCEFIINTADNPSDSLPTFSFSRRGKGRDILFPDFTFCSWPEAHNPSWKQTFRQLQAANHDYGSKSKTLFWSGLGSSKQRKSAFAVAAAVANKSMMDIRHNGFGHTPTPWKGLSVSGDFKSVEQHCDYAFLLHLEGGSPDRPAYSSRLKYLMLCGSTVMVPYTHDLFFHEWWTPALTPGTHFVALQPDVSDLRPVLQDLMLNGTRSMQAARTGTALADKLLHPRNVKLFAAQLIREYAKRLAYNVTPHPDLVAVEVALLYKQATIT